MRGQQFVEPRRELQVGDGGAGFLQRTADIPRDDVEHEHADVELRRYPLCQQQGRLVHLPERQFEPVGYHREHLVIGNQKPVTVAIQRSLHEYPVGMATRRSTAALTSSAERRPFDTPSSRLRVPGFTVTG